MYIGLFLNIKKLTFVSGLALFLSSTITMAYPMYTHVIITCPCSNELQNVDGNISGLGSELILSQSNTINFSSSLSQPDLPNNFYNYTTTGIEYENVSGDVSCNYTSRVATEQPFTLVYNLMNGAGGIIRAQSTKTISILLPVGLTH